MSLLPMVLDSHRAPHLEHFLEVSNIPLFLYFVLISFLQFLGQCTTAHTVINLDQWNSFLTFQSTDVDLSNYDDNGACKLHPNLFTNSSEVIIDRASVIG